jgi:hypothetical protein
LMGRNEMWQREHDGEATTSRSGTFFAEAIRILTLIVAGHFAVQHLMLVEKDRNGSVTTRQLLPVQFVPLLGQR